MKTQVFFKVTAVLMTALLICACEKGEKDDYKLGQDLSQMVTVIADIGKDAGTKITLGKDLGSTTEMLWSPEDSIALTDGQKLYVFTRSDDSDVPTERAEFTYNGKAGSLPAAGTERLKFIYPVSAPEQYSQQSGTIAVLSEYMQMEAVIPEGTVSLGGLLLTFSHKTAVIKLELENEAFINQEASVIFAFRDLADGKDKTIKTQNLKADANGVVTAYLVHPAASVDNLHIYVKTSSALYETTLSPKQIIPGKLYKVRKNDFVQSNIGLEGMLPEGDIFRSAVEQLMLQNSSIVRIKFIAESEVDGTPIGDSDATMVVNGDCLEIHTSASEFIFNEDCSEMFRGFRALVEIDFNDCINTSNVTDMSQMFSDCRSLTSLDLSGFDTSEVTDMNLMFYICYSLTSIDLTGFSTSNVADMSEMFRSCSSLPSLDLSGFDTSNVADMSCMFLGCRSLTSLDLSGFDTSNVADMSCMFSGCSPLTSLDLSGFETSNVADMSLMFCDCQSLTSLDLSGFNTSKVANMSRMFSQCLSLTTLDLSGFNTSKVADMSEMFRSCRSLPSLDLSSFDTSEVTDMKIMFSGCRSLTTLDLSGFDTSEVTDMSGMFSQCQSLTSVDLSSFDTSNVTTMNFMFPGCVSLTSLDLSGFNTSKVANMNRMFSDCRSLTSLDLSGFDTSEVTDMHRMFYNCYSLTSLDLTSFDFIEVESYGYYMMFSSLGSDAPDKPVIISVTQEGYDMLKDKVTGIDPLYAVLCSTDRLVTGTMFNSAVSQIMSQDSSIIRIKFIAESQKTGTPIGVSGATMVVNGDCLEIHTSASEFIFNESCSGMFRDFRTLVEVDFNDCINTSNVTNMSQMFIYCQSLASLDLSGLNTSNVTNMSHMFHGCEALTSLDLSGFDTSNVQYMYGMFSGLTLTTLDLSGFDTSNVTDMSYMFSNCSITSLDLSGFDTSNVTNMSRLFYGSESLTTLDLSGFETSKVTDMSSMFSQCQSLTSLDLSGFDTSNVTDMSRMFFGCSFTSLDLSSFDTSNVTDMSGMFHNCYYLTSLDLTGFDFIEVKSYNMMFAYLGSGALYKPIGISVTQEGHDILNAQSTGIDDSYARLVVVP